MSRKRKKIPQEPIAVAIEKLAHEGRGISHIDGKITFIHGALPGEEVLFHYRQRASKIDQGQCVEVLKPSPKRIEAQCRHFGVCGGCSLQHMDHSEQIKHKQTVLVELFEQFASVTLPKLMPPLHGLQWGYRRKARLGVKYILKKEKLLIGFREVSSRYLADLEQCEVVHENIGYRLQTLQQMISGLSIYRHIPQIEVAIAENHTALILRHLLAFTDADIAKLNAFEEESGLLIYLQSKGPDTVQRLTTGTNDPLLTYNLPEFDITLAFRPNDFTQINFEINRKMIQQALELLDLKKTDRILDLFCGLGNFTLPLARSSAHVIGVEGDAELVQQAKHNARKNAINNVAFFVQDLADENIQTDILSLGVNKLLLDPSRRGADSIIRRLDLSKIERIVYVSCNPASLARDAGILVHEKGFQLTQAGVMDMFPHTAHIESMALFINSNYSS